MDAGDPLATLLIILALLLLVVCGTVASVGMVTMFIPSLRPWIAEQIRRLLKGR